MSHCRDCKHWNPSAISNWEAHMGWGLCELASTEDGKPVVADTLFCADNLDRCKGWLTTKSEFGCNQFEPLVPVESAPLTRQDIDWANAKIERLGFKSLSAEDEARLRQIMLDKSKPGIPNF